MQRSLLLLVLLAACGAPPEPSTPRQAPASALEPSAPVLAEGVVAIAPACAEGAEEACNALDDDCDGAIDEGCEGALEGALVTAIAWNGAADVDLVLTGPGEAEQVASAGECAEPPDPALERAAFEAVSAGAYRVELARAACGDEGPITASLTLAVNGRTLGTFNRTLAPGERAPVLSVELAPAAPGRR